MFQVYPNKSLGVDVEFLAHEKGLLCVTRTIKDTGLEADTDGSKWVPKGSYIDENGEVTVPTVTSTTVEFTKPPVGILFSPVNVTYGPAAGAVMIAGWVKGDYMDWGDQEYTKKLGEEVHKLLPEINFKGLDGSVVFGPVAAGE